MSEQLTRAEIDAIGHDALMLRERMAKLGVDSQCAKDILRLVAHVRALEAESDEMKRRWRSAEWDATGRAAERNIYKSRKAQVERERDEYQRRATAVGAVLDDLLERLASDNYCELCGDLYPDDQYSTGEHEDGCAIAAAITARYAPDAEGASDDD